MKIVTIAIVVTMTMGTVPVFAQTGNTKDEHAHHMAATPAPQARTYKASGVVKKIDVATGRVSLAHGAVAELQWPAMTMAFTVKDKALLEKLVLERKVDFEFMKQGSSYIVTAVK